MTLESVNLHPRLKLFGLLSHLSYKNYEKLPVIHSKLLSLEWHTYKHKDTPWFQPSPDCAGEIRGIITLVSEHGVSEHTLCI